MFGWLFKDRDVARLEAEVEALKLRQETFTVEFAEAIEKITAAARRIETRQAVRNHRQDEAEEKEQLQLLLSGVDWKDPEKAIQELTKNPAVMQYAMNKLVGEVL